MPLPPPLPSAVPSPGAPARVVTLGGGHGQAALLAGLLRLDVDITAIAGVADDGGCSGRLRSEFGMPPPGDLRRCLTALAQNRELADLFEARVAGADGANRSAGNLALLQAHARLGGLQAAVDWAAELLGCRGRVAPAAEVPGRLFIYDRTRGELTGETEVAARGSAPMVVAVHDVEIANPVALAAIAAADYIFIGPGSFVTSTLATLMTGDLAEALVATRATRILMHNLVPEPGQTEHFTLRDYVRLLRDHVCIVTGVPDLPLVVMRDGPPSPIPGEWSDWDDAADVVHVAALASPGDPGRHDPELVAAALCDHFGFPRRGELVHFTTA